MKAGSLRSRSAAPTFRATHIVCGRSHNPPVTLDQHIGVRIPGGQPEITQYPCGFHAILCVRPCPRSHPCPHCVRICSCPAAVELKDSTGAPTVGT